MTRQRIIVTRDARTLPGSTPGDVVQVAADGEALELGTSGGGVVVEDEGTSLGSASTLNFAGAGVTATLAGGVGTVTVPGGGGGGSAPTVVSARAGYGITGTPGTNLTLSATSLTAVDTAFDLTVAAATGDVLELVQTFRTADAAAAYLLFDAATWVSGAAVNYFGTGPSANGLSGWMALPSVESSKCCTAYYTVQAGDLVSGNVTVRLLYRIINVGASSRSIARDYDRHELWLTNLHQ